MSFKYSGFKKTIETFIKLHANELKDKWVRHSLV